MIKAREEVRDQDQVDRVGAIRGVVDHLDRVLVEVDPVVDHPDDITCDDTGANKKNLLFNTKYCTKKIPFP